MAWSHGSRFDLARRLVADAHGGRLLDYGCGDGTFIAMVHANFARALGVDIEPRQLGECQARLGHLPGVAFAPTATVADGEPGAWDVVTCMEVLEHCMEDERRRVVDVLARLVAPSGRIVISVPIEIGPSVAGKQFFRMIAALRGFGDYRHRERYTPLEMCRAATGRRVTRAAYEGSGPDGAYRYYGHKGFDFRDLEREIAERLAIERRLFTPLPAFGPILNSQAWYVCRRRN